MKKHIVIISPALASANNGNWQTASRWARMLRSRYFVAVMPCADAVPPFTRVDLVIALHARRSATALAALRAQFPAVPVILVLTGTDLYRDIQIDATARHCLRSADRLVVLQAAGIAELPPELHARTQVIYQSAPALKAIGLEVRLRARRFDVCMIGHLRAEKDPLTFMRAARQIQAPAIRLIHIGSGTLDAALAAQAMQTRQACPHYRWLGNLPHAATRQRLKRCHLMVIASRMEGGANVIIEAVTSGVPVLASDISGNRGMLGDNYAGYFPVGDSAALAHLIERTAIDTAYYATLHEQCRARALLFAPERETAALLELVDNTLRQ